MAEDRVALTRLVRRRWILPSWAVSVLVHAVLVGAVVAASVGVSKVVPDEPPPMRVGLKIDPSADAGKSRPSDSTLVNDDTWTSGPVDLAPLDDLTPLSPPSVASMPALPVVPQVDNHAWKTLSAGMPEPATGAGLASSADLLGTDAGPAKVSFFGAEAQGQRFVFVIDRSGSMARQDSAPLRAAINQVRAGLQKLRRDHFFQVIVYNDIYELVSTAGLAHDHGMLEADAVNHRHTLRFLNQVAAKNGTDHQPALLAALRLEPDVIFFLTDADLMSRQDVRQLTQMNHRLTHSAAIHTVEFGVGPSADDEKPLQRLARQNHGSYRYIDLTKTLWD